MRTARKLVLAFSLALAALSAIAASANAVTVDPAGDYSGTEAPPGVLSTNSGITITCDSSNWSATIASDGTGVFTSITFSVCTRSAGSSCTITVDTEPIGFRITSVRSQTATWTFTNTHGTTETAVIICAFGFVNCTVTVDPTEPTAGGSVSTTGPGQISVDNATVGISGGGACGTQGTWDSTWTITNPVNYTITG